MSQRKPHLGFSLVYVKILAVSTNEFLTIIEKHPVLITIILSILTVFGFLIKQLFFQEKTKRQKNKSVIQAGGDISAGRDIIAGDKKVINKRRAQISKNLKTFTKLKEIWVYDKNNTYQIHQEQKRDFSEEWARVFPDKDNSALYHIYLKINGITIKQV